MLISPYWTKVLWYKGATPPRPDVHVTKDGTEVNSHDVIVGNECGSLSAIRPI